MNEAVTFWLDNKVSSGLKVAEIGRRILVSYRERFYVVEGGAALMKGSKPLHYSRTSLPTDWKKAQRGIYSQTFDTVTGPEEGILPVTTSHKRERKKMSSATVATPTQQEGASVNATVPQPASQQKKLSAAKPAATHQTAVTASCPYCNFKQELPLEKGKNGRAFFTACPKCAGEFAVRFVPVTIFQAQVAAFR